MILHYKQGWRILQNPISLPLRVMQAKYYPFGNFSIAALGHRPSYIQWSILAAQLHLLQEVKMENW